MFETETFEGQFHFSSVCNCTLNCSNTIWNKKLGQHFGQLKCGEFVGNFYFDSSWLVFYQQMVSD